MAMNYWEEEKILRSYEKGDIEYIKKIANKRLKIIRKKNVN